MVEVVVDESCIGCGACVDACPSSVFELKDGKAVVVAEDKCVACMSCVDACPVSAIKVKE